MKPRDSGLDERGVCIQGLTARKSNHKAVLSPRPRGSHQGAPLSSQLHSRGTIMSPSSTVKNRAGCLSRKITRVSHLICPAQRIFSTAKRSFSCCSLGRVLKRLFYPGTAWLRCLKNSCLVQRQNLSPNRW